MQKVNMPDVDDLIFGNESVPVSSRQFCAEIPRVAADPGIFLFFHGFNVFRIYVILRYRMLAQIVGRNACAA